MQPHCTSLDVYTDSDWAGCRKTRKSTSGGAVMLGGHCLKTWSKTQAIIAKSSAEAELYGVVRGATEALGMCTLIKDLGGEELQIELHLDATAAKGIIERRGLSKVRHVDVNVLWLQETCARRAIPLNKVPGEENCADLMTKHLSAKVIDKNVLKMHMKFEVGRAAKAAALHAISIPIAKGVEPKDQLNSFETLGDWPAVRRAANDERGGDRWKCRGSNGVWHRWHTSPRVAFFTPYRVAKGPSKGVSLCRERITFGVTASGRQFECRDDWTKPDRAHIEAPELWTGYTIFKEVDLPTTTRVSEGKPPKTGRREGQPGATRSEPAADGRWGFLPQEDERRGFLPQEDADGRWGFLPQEDGRRGFLPQEDV